MMDVREDFDIVRAILQAEKRLRTIAPPTRLVTATKLSEQLGCLVLLKLENEQPDTHSFKWRGAAIKITSLSQEQRGRGIITASAGNHAQGVALMAGKLGIPAIIVMPSSAPPIKVDNVKALGKTTDGRNMVNVVLEGAFFDQALQHALSKAEDEGRTFIHPYDDEDVIAGQGTIGLEILEQYRQHYAGPVEAIFCPAGGGGLLAGVANFVKRFQPHTKIIAVEPRDSNCCHRASLAGHPVKLDRVGLHSGGTAVRQMGDINFALAMSHTDKFIDVRNDQINDAIGILLSMHQIAEEAGALGVAGIRDYVARGGGRHGALIAIVSGGNLDFKKLALIADMKDSGGSREMLLDIVMGSSLSSLKKLGAFLANEHITEFEYRPLGDGQARVFVRLPFSDYDKRHHNFISAIKQAAFEVTNNTQNPLVKDHEGALLKTVPLRLEDSRLCRVKIPRYPGGFQRMLDTLCDALPNLDFLHFKENSVTYDKLLFATRMTKAGLKVLRDGLEKPENGCQTTDETGDMRQRRSLYAATFAPGSV